MKQNQRSWIVKEYSDITRAVELMDMTYCPLLRKPSSHSLQRLQLITSLHSRLVPYARNPHPQTQQPQRTAYHPLTNVPVTIAETGSRFPRHRARPETTPLTCHHPPPRESPEITTHPHLPHAAALIHISSRLPTSLYTCLLHCSLNHAPTLPGNLQALAKCIDNA